MYQTLHNSAVHTSTPRRWYQLQAFNLQLHSALHVLLAPLHLLFTSPSPPHLSSPLSPLPTAAISHKKPATRNATPDQTASQTKPANQTSKPSQIHSKIQSTHATHASMNPQSTDKSKMRIERKLFLTAGRTQR